MICEHNQLSEDCEECHQECEDLDLESIDFNSGDDPTMYGYEGDGH